MEENDRPPVIDRAELKLQHDLNSPSVRDVMGEFGRRIWWKGFNAAIDMVESVLKMRGAGLEPAQRQAYVEAAAFVAEMRRR